MLNFNVNVFGCFIICCLKRLIIDLWLFVLGKVKSWFFLICVIIDNFESLLFKFWIKFFNIIVKLCINIFIVGCLNNVEL